MNNEGHTASVFNGVLPGLKFLKSFTRGAHIPLLALSLTLPALLLIPLLIISTGYIPLDDVLTHVARAVGNRSWDDVILLKQNVSLNLHNPGWDALLRTVYLMTGASSNTLVGLAITGMMAAFLLSGLVAVRRVESWLIALLVGFLANPDFLVRVSLGRPFIVSSSALILLLSLWGEHSAPVSRAARWSFSILAVLMASWIHGSWYLFVLPVVAFIATGRVREGLSLGLCCALGTLSGAVLTGHPLEFILHHIRHVGLVFGVVPHQLQVGELQAYSVRFPLMIVMVAGVIWTGWRNRTWRAFFEPVFVLMIIGLLLGFRVARFWLDWGMPALLVWIARMLDMEFGRTEAGGIRRIPVVLGLAAVLIITSLSDKNQRWTGNIRWLCGDKTDDRAWQEGLPESGGIVYSGSMHAFDIMFYRYPREQWRYVVGSEPALMPEKDLQIFIRIQHDGYNSSTVRPWVERLRSQDRLVIMTAGYPDIPLLEWHYIGTHLWSGKLRQKSGVTP